MLQAHEAAPSKEDQLPVPACPPLPSHIGLPIWQLIVRLCSFTFLGVFHIIPTECDNERKNAAQVLHYYSH